MGAEDLSHIDESWRLYPDTYGAKVTNGRFKIYRHISYISEQITPALYKGGARFCVQVPPRHGKSEFISKHTPAWFLDTFPAKNVILASYAAELATGFGRHVRDHFETSPFTQAKLKAGSSSASRFSIKHNVERIHQGQKIVESVDSEMIAAGVDGGITGKGFHLGIIDDPYKNWKQANSPEYRKHLIDWFESTFYTRQEPNASIIVLHTRWRHDDLIGYLMDEHSDDWTLISLPALAMAEGDLLGRKEGEVLCPERYTQADMEKLRDGLPSQKWNPLYQQKPSKDGGTVFNRSWWQYYEKIPAIRHKVQFWDTAQKPAISNDYSVCATWGIGDDGYYLLDLWRDKVELPDLEAAVIQQYNKWNPVAVVVEDKGSGTSILQIGRKETRIPFLPYTPKQSKELRAIDATPTIKAKRCFLPKNGTFTADFVEEHEHFPVVDNDDQVDTTSMAVEYFNNLEYTDDNPTVEFL